MSKPKRVLFICQYFYPEIFRGNDIAYDLVARGVEVTVICGTPNYPQGKTFPGYGWFRRTIDIVQGVKVIRLPIIPRGKGSKIKLLANYFSYFISASLFIPIHILINKQYDICFVQQLSPVMMSMPGIVFKRLTGRRLYTWVLDLWPESLKAAGGISNRYILGLFNWFAKLEYKYSDKILVSSKGFENNIISKGDFADKILYMPNWAEDAVQNPVYVDVPDYPKGFNVLFAGNIGEAQDFESIVEAANLLRREDGIHFIILGDGRKREWLQSQIKKNDLEDIIILLGRYDIEYMPSFFNKANCLLLSLKDNEILNLTIPAKLQAYMTSGKPIIGMINGEANMLINDIKCGISVPASSPSLLVKALLDLKNMPPYYLEKMGNRGKVYCEKHFDKTKILDSLYKLMFS